MDLLISTARSFLHPFSLKQDIFLLYTDSPNVNEIWKSSFWETSWNMFCIVSCRFEKGMEPLTLLMITWRDTGF